MKHWYCHSTIFWNPKAVLFRILVVSPCWSVCKKFCLVVLACTVVPTPVQLWRVGLTPAPPWKCESALAVVPDKGRGSSLLVFLYVTQEVFRRWICEVILCSSLGWWFCVLSFFISSIPKFYFQLKKDDIMAYDI